MAKFFNVNQFRKILNNTLEGGVVSIPQAAEAMDISARTLYHFLDGKTPSVETLDCMAAYVNGRAGVYLS